MANVLMPYHQLAVLNLLVEGASLRSITRTTGVHRTTIARLMLSTGGRLRAFMDRRMRNLTLSHLQCDEIWTFVLKKQGKLTPTEAGNDRIGDQFLFVALDEETKLIPAFALGKRTRETTGGSSTTSQAALCWWNPTSAARARNSRRTAGSPTGPPSRTPSASGPTTAC